MRIQCLYITIVSLAVLLSCSPRPKNQSEQIVALELQRKYKEYLSQKRSDCLDNIHLEAEIFVDSIIHELSQFNILDDSIKMIEKPSGPDRPQYIDIKDKGPIVPYKIDSTTIND